MKDFNFHSTTILAVRHNSKMVLAGDGQVTVSNTIMKHSARKIRRIKDTNVVAGFAGGAADGFTLFELFEKKFKEHNQKLDRAAVELAKSWRTDKYLRRLEALLIVGDPNSLLVLSGMGDVIQPDDGVAAIGSGGNFALAAARGIIRASANTVSAMTIAKESMKIASEICPFTNDNLCFEEIDCE